MLHYDRCRFRARPDVNFTIKLENEMCASSNRKKYHCTSGSYSKFTSAPARSGIWHVSPVCRWNVSHTAVTSCGAVRQLGLHSWQPRRPLRALRHTARPGHCLIITTPPDRDVPPSLPQTRCAGNRPAAGIERARHCRKPGRLVKLSHRHGARKQAGIMRIPWPCELALQRISRWLAV